MGIYILAGLAALDLLIVIYLLIILKKILKRPIQPELIVPHERPKPEGLIRTKGTKKKRKEKVYLTPTQKKEVIRLKSIGRSNISLAKEFGCSDSTICNIYSQRWFYEDKKGD